MLCMWYHFYTVQVQNPNPNQLHFHTHPPPMSCHSTSGQWFPVHSAGSHASQSHYSHPYTALHLTYAGGKSQPSRDYPTFHFVFEEKKLSTPAAGYLTPGQSFAMSRQKLFGVLEQAYSLMSPIWTGNKVMLFTLHKVSTWICYSWFWWNSCESLRVFRSFIVS